MSAWQTRKMTCPLSQFQLKMEETQTLRSSSQSQILTEAFQLWRCSLATRKSTEASPQLLYS